MIGASPIFAVRIEREMVAVVRGVAVEDLDDCSGPLTPNPSPRSTGARGERVVASLGGGQ